MEENTNEKPVYRMKIIVIGDKGTGKTSFIERYVNNSFSSKYKLTIGVDFSLKQIEFDDKIINLQLWDIAGQERFRHMTRPYYKDTLGAIIVIDISNFKTLQSAKLWKEDLDTKFESDFAIPHVLICNKSDLYGDLPDCIEDDDLEHFCIENGFQKWFKVSAKNDTNVKEAMDYIVQIILDNVELEHEDTPPKGIRLQEDSHSEEDSKPKGKRTCCRTS